MSSPSRKKNGPAAAGGNGGSTNATVATVATAVTVSMLGAISYAASSALSQYFPDQKTSPESDFSTTVPTAIARVILNPPIDLESEQDSYNDLCDLLNSTTTATITDLEGFSTTCDSLIRTFLDKGDMKKVGQLAAMNQVVMETRDLRLESSQASLNGNDTSMYPSRLAEKERQIRQCQKDLAASFPDFVSQDQSIVAHKTERKSSFLSRVRETIMGPDDKKSGSVTPHQSTNGKRVLRSDASSTTSTAAKKTKRNLEDCEHRQGDASAFRRSPSGKRLCSVDGCTKVAGGTRSNQMCRKHYNESKRKPLEQRGLVDVGETEEEDDSPLESQETSDFLGEDDLPTIKKCAMTGKRLCSVDGCGKLAQGRRCDYMCTRHYNELHSHECTGDEALGSAPESQEMSTLTVEDSQDIETILELDKDPAKLNLFDSSDGGNSEEDDSEDGRSVEE